MQEDKQKIQPQAIDNSTSLLSNKKHKSFPRKIIMILGSILIVLVSALMFISIWYFLALNPLDYSDEDSRPITIKSGSTTAQIADQLKSGGIIKNSSAFRLYLRFSGNGNLLQAGDYQFSPANSVYEIVDNLIAGTNTQFSITFFPGATLVDNTSKDVSKKTDVVTVLEKAGYANAEIIAALDSDYNSPLFDSKPDGADLEGYIYGDTYTFEVGTSVNDIFEFVFDKFYSDISDNNLITKFSNRGLSLYEGITLASIIQREVNSDADRKKVAQVFYNRIELGMQLGSDVTYQYITDKLGVDRDVNFDSPYNTRRYTGLTPGPIASPSLSSLLAVAEPTDGDYLYFLSGDDDITYFANTYAEHEANIVNHCTVKCSVL